MNPFTIRQAYKDEYAVLLKIDEAANTLFSQVGITFDFENDHPFILEESKRWEDAFNNGRCYFTVDSQDHPVGFILLGYVDDQPYLDQISVHPSYMRKGLGLMLLKKAIEWSGSAPLWLTTYAHVAWNKPFYERHGFKEVSVDQYGPDVCDALKHQRLVLPFPEERIAMVRTPNQ